MRWYADKAPNRSDLFLAYSVIVFLVYTWTIFASFYKFPSWIMYLDVVEILSVYAYSFVFSWVESLLVLAGVLLLEFTLFLFLKSRKGFTARALVMLLVIFGVSVTRLILYFDFDQMDVFFAMEKTWWLVAFPVAVLLALASSGFSRARVVLNGFAERTQVFLYVYLPLSFLSLVVVIVRNF